MKGSAIDRIVTVVILAAIFGAAVLFGHWAGHATHPQPHGEVGPAVTEVRLPNGQDITCITVNGTSSCDWLGLRSDPNYRETKP